MRVVFGSKLNINGTFGEMLFKIFLYITGKTRKIMEKLFSTKLIPLFVISESKYSRIAESSNYTYICSN